MLSIACWLLSIACWLLSIACWLLSTAAERQAAAHTCPLRLDLVSSSRSLAEGCFGLPDARRPVIPWLRLEHFQLVSLCQIVEALLRASPRYNDHRSQDSLKDGTAPSNASSTAAPAAAPAATTLGAAFGAASHSTASAAHSAAAAAAASKAYVPHAFASGTVHRHCDPVILSCLSEKRFAMPAPCCLYVSEHNPGSHALAHQVMQLAAVALRGMATSSGGVVGRDGSGKGSGRGSGRSGSRASSGSHGAGRVSALTFTTLTPPNVKQLLPQMLGRDGGPPIGLSKSRRRRKMSIGIGASHSEFSNISVGFQGARRKMSLGIGGGSHSNMLQSMGVSTPSLAAVVPSSPPFAAQESPTVTPRPRGTSTPVPVRMPPPLIDENAPTPRLDQPLGAPAAAAPAAATVVRSENIVRFADAPPQTTPGTTPRTLEEGSSAVGAEASAEASEGGTAAAGATPTVFLLLLSKNTFVGVAGDQLAAEVRAAWAVGLPIVTVHATPGLPDGDGCQFERFFSVTPNDLIRQGLFSGLAVPWYAGEHARVSFAVLMQALGAEGVAGGSCRRLLDNALRRGGCVSSVRV